MTSPPKYITCDPLSRTFPVEWKDIWFRRYAAVRDNDVPEYECPICKRRFDHSAMGELHGDHVWPWSLFGETSWDNYQLICSRCNAAKSNYLDTAIRRMLGSKTFRSMVRDFLVKEADTQMKGNPVFAHLMGSS